MSIIYDYIVFFFSFTLQCLCNWHTYVSLNANYSASTLLINVFCYILNSSPFQLICVLNIKDVISESLWIVQLLTQRRMTNRSLITPIFTLAIIKLYIWINLFVRSSSSSSSSSSLYCDRTRTNSFNCSFYIPLSFEVPKIYVGDPSATHRIMRISVLVTEKERRL